MNYTYLTSQTGEVVPAINEKPLHSLVDPVREAQRLVSTIPEDCGFVIFLGLGGGFAPLAAAETGAHVVVVDYDISELAASKDYSAIKILKDSANEEIKSYILTNYNPALHGGIKVLPLKTRCEHNPALFESASQSIQQAIDIVSGDFSVQAHFGKRWFCNIIRNLKKASTVADSRFFKQFPAVIDTVAIAAAGPSLDLQMDKLYECQKRGVFIISSDTALGALLNNNIKPDVIVSIDCQHISYYHFLGHDIKNIPLVLDIASPPQLSGCSSAPIFFASGHPFARYVCENFIPLPYLDTSGGNVTYACLSLAQSLGAQNITLFGADFAYIGAQTYAKGTYIYPFFEKKQNRFTTMEAQLSAFLYRSPFLSHDPGQQYRETSSLRFYRQKLKEKTGVSIVPASGVPVQIKKNSHRITRIKPNENIKSPVPFLEKYKNEIASLQINKINKKQEEILTTLLPYAAFIKHRNPQFKPQELLTMTKQCCIKEINKIINSC